MSIDTVRWQLGVTAATLITLPDPLPGIDKPKPLVGGRRRAMQGALTVQMWRKKYAVTLSWDVTDALFPTLWQFWDDDSPTYKGLGPFVLNDPTETYQPTVQFAQDPDHSIPYRGAHRVTFQFEEV